MFKLVIVIVTWLACGYVGAAMFAGDFYGRYGNSGIETKGTASRSACTLIVLGPIYMFAMWTLAEYPPMWDWPNHIFEYRHLVKP